MSDQKKEEPSAAAGTGYLSSATSYIPGFGGGGGVGGEQAADSKDTASNADSAKKEEAGYVAKQSKRSIPRARARWRQRDCQHSEC